MWNSRYDYIKQDELGRWINTEFPPVSFYQYPNNSGYKNSNSEMLFYQFAVQYYDLRIEYDGREYLAIIDDDGAYIADTLYNRISDIYPTANDLIRHFAFSDGGHLGELVQDAKRISIDIL